MLLPCVVSYHHGRAQGSSIGFLYGGSKDIEGLVAVDIDDDTDWDSEGDVLGLTEGDTEGLTDGDSEGETNGDIAGLIDGEIDGGFDGSIEVGMLEAGVDNDTEGLIEQPSGGLGKILILGDIEDKGDAAAVLSLIGKVPALYRDAAGITEDS